MFERYRRAQERRASGSVDEHGFTLIELLIVIVVLGILAAVVVFALGGVTSKSAIAACTSDAKTVEVAVEAFKANNGVYPTTNSQLTSAPTTGALGGPYLRSFPSNPTHYIISLDAVAGVVDVQTVIGGVTGAAVNYDTESSSTGCNAVV